MEKSQAEGTLESKGGPITAWDLPCPGPLGLRVDPPPCGRSRTEFGLLLLVAEISLIDNSCSEKSLVPCPKESRVRS